MFQKSHVVQILGFVYITGNNKSYSLNSAPTQVPDGVEARGLAEGLACLCNIFKFRMPQLFFVKHGILNISDYKVSMPPPSYCNGSVFVTDPASKLYLQ